MDEFFCGVPFGCALCWEFVGEFVGKVVYGQSGQKEDFGGVSEVRQDESVEEEWRNLNQLRNEGG